MFRFRRRREPVVVDVRVPARVERLRFDPPVPFDDAAVRAEVVRHLPELEDAVRPQDGA
ncbi:hypothetical protein [Patulibacter minatonensis]|uniref:hypothetical protein n=1 Tax=Patulibacter minatonensis TaxID=298163 RepID=UPI0012F99CB9|nr:hypothetical protein [Patulibacter minatonensis]